MALAMLLVGAGRVRSAVSLVTALPSLGQSIDARKTSATGAREGIWVVDLGYAYRHSTQRFDSSGEVADLMLNQEVQVQGTTLTAMYGVSDRFSSGFSIQPTVGISQHIAVTNFAAGVTVLGSPLAVGRLSTFELGGAGTGDLTLSEQYQLTGPSRRTQHSLLLDVLLPTARSDPHNALDLPIGQGNATLTPGWLIARETYPFSTFLRLSYDVNLPGTLKNLDGTSTHFVPGDGPSYVLGGAFQSNPYVSFRANLLGAVRGERVQDGVDVPASHTFSLEARPEMDFTYRGRRFAFQVILPVAGKNVLRTTGSFVSYEQRF